MLKNKLFQFTDLCNMTCVHCRVKYKLFVCIKTTPSCIHKKKLKLCFCVWTRMTWPRISESTLPLKYHPTNLERQLRYLKWNNVPLTVQQFKHNALSLEFPGAVFCLNLLEAPSFLESIWFFFLSFLNHMVFDKFIQFKSYVKSASHYYYCFNVFTDR